MNVLHSYMNATNVFAIIRWMCVSHNGRGAHTQQTHLFGVCCIFPLILSRPKISNIIDSHTIVNLLIFLETIFHIFLLLLEMDAGGGREGKECKIYIVKVV